MDESLFTALLYSAIALLIPLAWLGMISAIASPIVRREEER